MCWLLQAQDEAYTLFFVNNNWYLFFRLHQILCERLTKIYERAIIIASEEAKDSKDRKDSTAVALRLKPKSMKYFFKDCFYLLRSFTCLV